MHIIVNNVVNHQYKLMTLCFRVLIEMVLLSTHNICSDLGKISITHYYSYLVDRCCDGGEALVAWGIKYHILYNKHILYTMM